MAAVRSYPKQGAPFSAWEELDTVFEQAFSTCYPNFSPLVSSPYEFSDYHSKMPRSFASQANSYYKPVTPPKPVPVPQYYGRRKDSFCSSPSSISSTSTLHDCPFDEAPSRVSLPSPPPPSQPTRSRYRASKPTDLKIKTALPHPATQPVVPVSPTKHRVARVRYCESTGSTQSAVFSLPKTMEGDVHVGFTQGQLEIRWDYTKTKKILEGDRIVSKPKHKRFTKVIPLREGTKFNHIKTNINGRQLTITYPK